MNTTSKQDHDFHESVLPAPVGFLEHCIEWITNEFSPEELYGRDVLIQWGRDNLMVDSGGE